MIRPRWSALVPVLALLAALTLALPRAARAATPPVLEVGGPAGTRSFTLAELKKLRPAAGLAGTLNSAGRIVKPVRFAGVALADVIAAAGGAGGAQDVVVTARDGYRLTYTREQVTKGDFVAFDPATGDTLADHEPLALVLAWEQGGRPLAGGDGRLRSVVVGAKGAALTDAHLSVKDVTKVTLVAAAAAGPWALALEGARVETIDQAAFESGAAPGCHGATWKDAPGRAWSGVPLWLLVGWVDDARKHGTGAFADDLASGYEVELTGAGGASVVLPGERVARNDGLLVAHRLDGAPLAGDAFPLRLTGPDAKEGETLGGIVKLVIRRREGGGPAK